MSFLTGTHQNNPRRRFQQWGSVFGLTPGLLTASIDGEVIFDGAVDAVHHDQYRPDDAGQELFGWFDDINFTGHRRLRIQVHNGDLHLTHTLANYVWVSDTGPHCGTGSASFGTKIKSHDEIECPCPATDTSDPEPPDQTARTGGPEFFAGFFQRAHEDFIVTDPFSDVVIDGAAQPTKPYQLGAAGQWYWYLSQGQVFECDINVLSGIALPQSWDQASGYPSHALVDHMGVVYCSWTAVPPGVSISDPGFWRKQFLDAWSPDSYYQKNSHVWYQGASYRAQKDLAPAMQFDASDWQLLFRDFPKG